MINILGYEQHQIQKKVCVCVLDNSTTANMRIGPSKLFAPDSVTTTYCYGIVR